MCMYLHMANIGVVQGGVHLHMECTPDLLHAYILIFVGVFWYFCMVSLGVFVLILRLYSGYCSAISSLNRGVVLGQYKGGLAVFRWGY